MLLEPRKIINSPFGLGLANLIGRYTPYWLGYRIALYISDRISARKDWKLVHATRCNQWVVHGEQLSGSELDRVVEENFRSIACSIFDLYHNINNSAAFLRLFNQRSGGSWGTFK
jgi:hypothetical protein